MPPADCTNCMVPVLIIHHTHTTYTYNNNLFLIKAQKKKKKNTRGSQRQYDFNLDLLTIYKQLAWAHSQNLCNYQCQYDVSKYIMYHLYTCIYHVYITNRSTSGYKILYKYIQHDTIPVSCVRYNLHLVLIHGYSIGSYSCISLSCFSFSFFSSSLCFSILSNLSTSAWIFSASSLLVITSFSSWAICSDFSDRDFSTSVFLWLSS